jgi:hypothetical protein
VNVETFERFMARVRVDYDSGCWLWTASLSAGYAQFHTGDRFSPAGNRVASKGHRLMYEHFIGPIPPELEMDHLCENKPCVNPLHVEPVTSRENNLRIHNRRGTCPKGHPYNKVNTAITPGGSKRCRVCHRDWEREYKRRKAAQRRGVDL